jgi:hypothetical protein
MDEVWYGMVRSETIKDWIKIIISAALVIGVVLLMIWIAAQYSVRHDWGRDLFSRLT